MNKNYLAIIGIVGIVLILTLGCTSQSTNEYSYDTTQETRETAEQTTQVEIKEETVIQPVQEEASAMDWYSIAENEALQWRTDAKLIEIRGDNKENDKYSEVDGKSDSWIYNFVSVSRLLKYRIVIEKGIISEIKEYDEPLAKMQYDSSPSGNDWVIDSTAAVNTVNEEANGNDFLATKNNVKANYILKLEGMSVANPIVWTISYFPESYGQNLIVNINAETGNVI